MTGCRIEVERAELRRRLAGLSAWRAAAPGSGRRPAAVE